MREYATSTRLPSTITAPGGLGHRLNHNGYAPTYNHTTNDGIVMWAWRKHNAPTVTIGFDPEGHVRWSFINGRTHVGLRDTGNAVNRLLGK